MTNPRETHLFRNAERYLNRVKSDETRDIGPRDVGVEHLDPKCSEAKQILNLYIHTPTTQHNTTQYTLIFRGRSDTPFAEFTTFNSLWSISVIQIEARYLCGNSSARIGEVVLCQRCSNVNDFRGINTWHQVTATRFQQTFVLTHYSSTTSCLLWVLLPLCGCVMCDGVTNHIMVAAPTRLFRSWKREEQHKVESV